MVHKPPEPEGEGYLWTIYCVSGIFQSLWSLLETDPTTSCQYVENILLVSIIMSNLALVT